MSSISQLYVSQLLVQGTGYSGTDIARLYHTKPNYIGAWISRAADKLRKDAAILGFIETDVEKSTTGS